MPPALVLLDASDNIGTFITMLEVWCLLVPTIGCATYGLYQVRWRRTQAGDPPMRAIVSLAAALLLVVFSCVLFSNAPAFDTMEYCQKYIRVRYCGEHGLKLARDELRPVMVCGYLRYVLLPLIIGTASVLLAVRIDKPPSD